MEKNETAAPGKGSTLETSPPRRRIEMNRALMPGGMTVTTKTTTTERLRDQREDPLKYNGTYYSSIHSFQIFLQHPSSSPLLLKGAPDYSIDTVSELTHRSCLYFVLYCIVSIHLYIYIALLAVHSNKKCCAVCAAAMNFVYYFFSFIIIMFKLW